MLGIGLGALMVDETMDEPRQLLWKSYAFQGRPWRSALQVQLVLDDLDRGGGIDEPVVN